MNTEAPNKKKNRFNVIDLLIILAIIALVAGIALRFNIGEKVGVKTEKETAVITFLVERVKPTTATAIADNEVFSIKSTGARFGEIITYSTSEAEVYSPDENGKIVLSYDPDRVDIRGEIKAEGNMTDSGFMLNGTTYMAANKEVVLTSKDVTFTIRITGIRSESK